MVNYTYDGLYRLTGEKRSAYGGGDPGVTYNYGYVYDDAGNRTQFITMDQSNNVLTTTNYSYDAANKMQSPGTFTYDDAGNTTQIVSADQLTTTNNTWDYRNLMTEWQKTGQTTQDFLYDGNGMRIRTTPSGGTPTDYLLDGAQIAEAINGSNVTSYVGPGLTQVITPSMRTVYHADGLGSTRAINVETSGVVTEAAIYDAYGNRMQEYLQTGQTSPILGYAGGWGYYDDPTGLDYLQHGSYDPKVGRFVSRDPIGYRGGLNTYRYAADNPCSYVDPSGLCCVDQCMKYEDPRQFQGPGNAIAGGGIGTIPGVIIGGIVGGPAGAIIGGVVGAGGGVAGGFIGNGRDGANARNELFARVHSVLQPK